MATETRIITWKARAAQDPSVWAAATFVGDFRVSHTPVESEMDADEAWLQEAFRQACEELAMSGSIRAPASRTVRAFIHGMTLARMHGRDAWDESLPAYVYRNAINKFEKTILETDDKTKIDETKTDNSTATTTTTGTSTSSKPGATGTKSKSNTNASQKTRTSGTSKSQGPLKPDLMIAVKQRDGPSHPVWTCEIKFVTYNELGRSGVWERRHREGLAQAVWYLFSANSLCGASTGLLLVNGRFQRLLVRTLQVERDDVAGDDNGTKVLVVEVVSGSAKTGLQDGFDGYKYGKESIPNLLPSDAVLPADSTGPTTPTYRLWYSLVMALEIAEARAKSESPCDGVRVHHPTRQYVPEFNIQLEPVQSTMQKILDPTPTFKRAKSKVQGSTKGSEGGKTDETGTDGSRGCGTGGAGGSGSGGGGDGGGGGAGSRGGHGGGGYGGGDGAGGRWTGTNRADDPPCCDVDGFSKKRSEMRREAPPADAASPLAPPLTPSPEQSRIFPRFDDRDMLEDWLKHQDAADTPESSVRSDDGKVEPVQSVELEFQDDVNMEGQDGDGDDVWESVSQRDENETDDSPFMQMDELTRWMGHYGWKFKLVTPEAMDVEMSKMAEQALGRSLAPNVSVDTTPR